MLKQIFQQQTSNRNIFSSSERQLIKKVEGSIYQPTIGKIKQFYPFADEHDFVMRTQNADIIDLILHNVSLMLLEDSQENSLDNCGSGIQSAVFFAISIALSMTEGINYLVGIEEPELNMHPQAQRKLIDTLQKREKYPNTQFVLTSHSTVIIDRLGHESIALCRKNKGEKRDVITTVSQVSHEFLRNYAIDKERYYNFFDFRNSDFFFSNFIIITESTKDCKVVQHLLELNGIDTEDKGISLIPVDGERNIKYPYSIAKELCIPFICVVDRDVFQPYLNNERKQSLDKNGLPQYKNELKASSPIIDFISPNDKDSLILAFSQNDYKNVIKILDKYNIVAMRFAFEIDLAICPSFCNALYTILNVEEGKRNLATLLTEKSNVLKDFLTLNSALDSQGIRNLPKSYRQIIINVKNGVNSSNGMLNLKLV